MIIYPENLQIHKPKKNLEEKINKIQIKEKILFEKESDFHSLRVVETDFGKFIKFSETYQAGFINSDFYKGNLPYINYFLIPYLMNPKIKNILLVGLGSGVLVKQFFELFDEIKTFDIVDIDENILEAAKKYFDFSIENLNFENKINFILQDAIIYLKQTKKKYDLIIVDVAGNEGVDSRFYDDEYLFLVKSRLNTKTKGIFVSNLPSSRDIFNKKNKITVDLINNYKKFFNHIKIFNGETSNKIFYKTFYNLDEVVFDITNLILISSDKDYNFKNHGNFSKFEKINVDIEKYLKDLV